MENKVRDLRQQLLNFEYSKSLSKNDFFVSESNFYAYSLSADISADLSSP